MPLYAPAVKQMNKFMSHTGAETCIHLQCHVLAQPLCLLSGFLGWPPTTTNNQVCSCPRDYTSYVATEIDRERIASEEDTGVKTCFLVDTGSFNNHHKRRDTFLLFLFTEKGFPLFTTIKCIKWNVPRQTSVWDHAHPNSTCCVGTCIADGFDGN